MFQDVGDTLDVVTDAQDPVLDMVLEVEERGGAFPTYPHFSTVAVSRWHG